MLETLIEQAKALPEEIGKLVEEVATKKQALHELLALRSQREAEIAGEVAGEVNGDGKKKYPNEESRSSEIARRLAQDEKFQDMEEMLKEVRFEAVKLEAELEKARYQHRSVTTLLTLAASALQAGNHTILEVVLGNGSKLKEEKTSNGSGLEALKVKILGVMPGKSEGTVKVLAQNGKEELTFYAKGETGKALAKKIGEVVMVRIKKMDSGNLLAVAVA